MSEGTTENTLWYCRLCFGVMAVTDIKLKRLSDQNPETKYGIENPKYQIKITDYMAIVVEK